MLDLLIEQDTLLLSSSRRKLIANALVSMIGMMQQGIQTVALADGIVIASVISWAIIVALIDDPTARLENSSLAAATQSQALPD